MKILTKDAGLYDYPPCRATCGIRAIEMRITLEDIQSFLSMRPDELRYKLELLEMRFPPQAVDSVERYGL